MIDRFEVVEALGAGAFATVWLVRDPVLELPFAVKVLADNWSRDRLIRRRFIEEARVLAQSTSARIIRVHNVGELDDGRPFFVMTWADRGTLESRIEANTAAGKAFTAIEASAIISEIARAVADVHDGDRIHRDIKPANILITSTTSRSAVPIPGLAPDERLILGDFGLARSLDASAITFVSGSPAYVAPEQARGLDELTEKVDLYPIGIIAAELVTGTRPVYRGSMADAAVGEIEVAEHLARSGFNPDQTFRHLVQQLLDPNPDRRPGSALEVAEAFGAHSQHRPANPSVQSPHAASGPGNNVDPPPADDSTQFVRPPTVAPVGAPTEGRRSRWLLVAAAATVAVALAAGGAVILSTGSDSNPEEASSTSTTNNNGVETTEPTTAITDDSVSSSSTPAASSEIDVTPFPFPDTAVVTDEDDSAATAAVAASLQDVVDFYYQQIHTDWTPEPPTVNTSEEIRFQMLSSGRSADVLLAPTAQDVGAGVIEISVTYAEPSG